MIHDILDSCNEKMLLDRFLLFGTINWNRMRRSTVKKKLIASYHDQKGSIKLKRRRTNKIEDEECFFLPWTAWIEPPSRGPRLRRELQQRPLDLPRAAADVLDRLPVVFAHLKETADLKGVVFIDKFLGDMRSFRHACIPVKMPRPLQRMTSSTMLSHQHS